MRLTYTRGLIRFLNCAGLSRLQPSVGLKEHAAVDADMRNLDDMDEFYYDNMLCTIRLAISYVSHLSLCSSLCSADQFIMQ